MMSEQSEGVMAAKQKRDDEKYGNEILNFPCKTQPKNLLHEM